MSERDGRTCKLPTPPTAIVLAPCVKAIPLAFITSLDEVVILLFIAGGDTATLTRRMFNELRDEIDPTIAAISTLLILMSVVLLGLTQLLQRSPSSAPATDQAAGKR